MSDKPQETRVNDVENLKNSGQTGNVRLPVPSNDPNDPLVRLHLRTDDEAH